MASWAWPSGLKAAIVNPDFASVVAVSQKSRLYGVVCVGDVHGDLRAFLGVLSSAGLARVPENVLAVARACPRQHEERRRNEPLDASQFNSVRWTGGTAAVIFLGDVLDNRRGEDADEHGVCAHKGTQTQLMKFLVALHDQARESGGRVIWVLGNHDVANAMGGQIACRKYAPRWHTSPDNPEDVYETCGADGDFSQRHRSHVSRQMRRVEAVAVAAIVDARGRPQALCMHGGLTRESLAWFARLSRVRDVSRVYGLLEAGTPEDAVENVRRLNLLFHHAIHGFSRRQKIARSVVQKNLSLMPTWCRPKTVEDPATMRRLFHTSRLFKAHDVQKSGANCSGEGDTVVCKLDTGMSRCFARGDDTVLTWMEVREGRGGRIAWRIHTADRV